MSVEYILGVIVGVALSVIVLAVIYRLIQGTWRFKRCQYDERQQRARGIAYRNGFWTVMGCLLLWFCLRMTETTVLSTDQMLIFCLLVGLIVFVVSCIMLDAYLGLRENPKRVVLVLAAIAVLNLVCVGINVFRKGLNSFWWLNLACVIALTIALIALGVKALLRKREEEE